MLFSGEYHGLCSLEGYSPQGRKESDKTERLHLLRITVYLNLRSRLHHPTHMNWGCKFLGLTSSSNTYELGLQVPRADFLLGARLWGFPACCGEGFLYDLSLCTLTLFVPLAQESQQNNSPDWPESGKQTFSVWFLSQSLCFPFSVFSGNSVTLWLH